MSDIAEGKVTKVNKPMTGESEHGEWTMYKFVVTDSEGDHQCSTFSESIGELIKKGVTFKFSYDDNEFTTKKGEVVKEWRINELFGDIAPSSEPSPSQPTQQPAQRTLATSDPDFPYQYGRARSAAAILAGAMVSTGAIQPELFWATVNDQTLIGYKGELAQVERMQHPGPSTDTPSDPVGQSPTPPSTSRPENTELVQFGVDADAFKWVGDKYGIPLERWVHFARECEQFKFSNEEVAEAFGLPSESEGSDVIAAAEELFKDIQDKTPGSLMRAAFLHVWGKHQENTPEELPW